MFTKPLSSKWTFHLQMEHSWECPGGADKHQSWNSVEFYFTFHLTAYMYLNCSGLYRCLYSAFTVQTNMLWMIAYQVIWHMNALFYCCNWTTLLYIFLLLKAQSAHNPQSSCGRCVFGYVLEQISAAPDLRLWCCFFRTRQACTECVTMI